MIALIYYYNSMIMIENFKLYCKIVFNKCRFQRTFNLPSRSNFSSVGCKYRGVRTGVKKDPHFGEPRGFALENHNFRPNLSRTIFLLQWVLLLDILLWRFVALKIVALKRIYFWILSDFFFFFFQSLLGTAKNSIGMVVVWWRFLVNSWPLLASFL